MKWINLALTIVLCSCTQKVPRVPEPPFQGIATAPVEDEQWADQVVGRVWFSVGGARSDKSEEMERDPAYRHFSILLVQGKQAFKWGIGESYVLGTSSPQGADLVSVLEHESPWSVPEIKVQPFADHLSFSGSLNGRRWRWSVAYPEPTIDRIVRSIRPHLDGVLPAPAEYLVPQAWSARIVGRMDFIVDAGPPWPDTDWVWQPRYRLFSVVFIDGSRACQRMARVFAIGCESPQGRALLSIIQRQGDLNRSETRGKARLIFEGQLPGRAWRYAASKPDATLEQLASEINAVLDSTPKMKNDPVSFDG